MTKLKLISAAIALIAALIVSPFVVGMIEKAAHRAIDKELARIDATLTESL